MTPGAESIAPGNQIATASLQCGAVIDELFPRCILTAHFDHGNCAAPSQKGRTARGPKRDADGPTAHGCHRVIVPILAKRKCSNKREKYSRDPCSYHGIPASPEPRPLLRGEDAHNGKEHKRAPAYPHRLGRFAARSRQREHHHAISSHSTPRYCLFC